MPPEPLPFDRKDFFKERKPSSSEPGGIAPGRWREPPTTPSSHPNDRGSPLSCRWGGGGGGSSDFPRPFSGDGKQGGGGWHMTTAESGSRCGGEKYCRNDSSENNNNNRGSVSFGSERGREGGHLLETTASPNSNSHPRPDFVNSWDPLQSKDQQDKDNGGGLSATGNQRLEKENSLGSSIDWKPLKWVRSGSLSSRGSGFSHSSSSKSIGVDSLDTKVEAQPGSITPLQSPSGDAAPCVTSRAPEETRSRKKPRLGWGEGLAKYEKKKVDAPVDIVNKEAGARSRKVDCLSNSETMLRSPANLPDKSPSLTGYSECASPATPSSVACSSSPGVEEKLRIKAPAVDNKSCNPSAFPCHVSQNRTERLAFNLENLELTEVVNLSSSLNELLQSDDSNAVGSGFVRSTAMDKLQVWKANISKTLEVTESEIDSLELELKSLISDVGGSCPFPAASSSLPAVCNGKSSGPLPLRIISSGDRPVEKADGAQEECTEVKDLDRDSPGTATSKFADPFTFCNNISHTDAVKQIDCPVNLDVIPENIEAKSSLDGVSDGVSDLATACGDCSQVPSGGSLAADPVNDDLHYVGADDLCDRIVAFNRVLANRASEELSKLLPNTECSTNNSRATNELHMKEKFATRKRFLKFKERVIALKYRAFQYLWKEDLRLLSIRRSSAKSQKNLDLSLRTVYNGYQKHRSSIRSRFSSPAGNLSLVPTAEILNYTNKLLSDSQVRICRDTLKMPALILDKWERKSRFISNNGLVEDPCAVEKERYVVNPWTSEEKEIFLDKFALFGKDFKRIASFLEHKTIADCVEFYYKNHKSDPFQKMKKSPEFAKQGKSYPNTYLVTSGKRWNRETNAASLDMLGAASAIAANVEDGMEKQRKCISKFYIGTSKDNKQQRSDVGILERSDSPGLYGNERETAAADVLAGICGSISSEALSSCITSSMEPKDVCHQDWRAPKLGGFLRRRLSAPEASQNDIDEETCSDENCGGEIGHADWTDEEKSSFIRAIASYGKDFSIISRCVRTRSREQCKVFFSKARKCLGLDAIHEPGSDATTCANEGDGSDHEGACMVDSGSVVSCDKSSSEGKMEVQGLHLSDSKAEPAESDKNVVNDYRESEHCSENAVSDGCDAENNKAEALLVSERTSNGNSDEAADSEAAGNPKLEGDERNTSMGAETIDLPSMSSVEIEAETQSAKISREGIMESEHQLQNRSGFDANASEVGGLISFPAENLDPAGSGSLDLTMDHGGGLELNAAEKPCVDSFLSPNPLRQDFIATSHRKTLSQDDMSSRLSFRRSCDKLSQRSSSTDGYHRYLPKHSLLDCVESSQILRGYPVTISTTNGINESLNYNEPSKLERSLLLEHCLPRDCSLQTCKSYSNGLASDASFSQELKRASSPDVEKPRSGDVKLFGQILTHPSPQQPKTNGSSAQENGKQNGGRFCNMKFDNHSSERNLASLDSNQRYFGVENNVPLRSYGFWDGNRIQTGFHALPDSAILLAKYPSAFSNNTSSKFEPQQQPLDPSPKITNEQRGLNVNAVSGFQTRELSSSNNYHVYRNRDIVQQQQPPFSVDKFLLPEMQRRKDSDALSGIQQQGRGMVGINVVGCNGVSDPVAAIRMHYAKAEQYNNGGNARREGDPWRSSSGDIGSR